MGADTVQFFDTPLIEQRRRESGKSYLELLREASMSAGVYVLAAGSVDSQSPHREDELYYVIRGRGRFRAGGEDRAVTPGCLIFVAKDAEHRFHDIEEELTLLVFFAPAESA